MDSSNDGTLSSGTDGGSGRSGARANEDARGRDPHRDVVERLQGTGEGDEEIVLTVKELPSARGPVESVDRRGTLIYARTLMLQHDYSQLAVMKGKHHLDGVVSWESIAKAELGRKEVKLSDVTDPAHPVREDDDLIGLIPRIIDQGFVFVAGVDGRLKGIVTTADLSESFAQIAKPFLLVREIERRLRSSLRNVVTEADLAKARDPRDEDRTVQSVDDLTLGETIRLVQVPKVWERLNWSLDRTLTLDQLESVRKVRNDLAHFRPQESTNQVDILEGCARMLRNT